ncbi:TetR/AcrR family transcriptional regulator [Nocardia bovistercoris]|uniref:TetR family transcriptional regulator n=1 Tax=Nocardia bovistercoris TaxID=2785916 RepID=A0A931IFJ9_9NOCA|nr:TetR/AcrR family transcriptional regulator [Nocardia bovistercoris]MBH0779623.1 TetR family transcriptional regulator [Nocardia bovistercoris]
MSLEDRPSGRRKDATATRAALLTAARTLFSERGYERTTVRAIAAEAGVNQALLFRYFGSKSDLFRAALTDRGWQMLSDGADDSLPARLLASVLDPSDTATQGNWLITALRSADREDGALLIQRELGDAYARTLSTLTEAPDGELRADLLLAWLLGIALVRSVHRREPLAHADSRAVAEIVLRATQAMLENVDTNFPPG